MRRTTLAVWLLLIVVCGSDENLFAGKAKSNEGRIGDLLITAKSFQVTPAGRNNQEGFHKVVFEIELKNVGKQPICPSLKTKLEGSYSLEDSGTFRFKNGPFNVSDVGIYVYISRMLPGDELEGEIVFDRIRDGIDPVKLWIELSRTSGGNLGCSKSHPIQPFSPETKIPVRDVPRVQTGPDHQ